MGVCMSTRAVPSQRLQAEARLRGPGRIKPHTYRCRNGLCRPDGFILFRFRVLEECRFGACQAKPCFVENQLCRCTSLTPISAARPHKIRQLPDRLLQPCQPHRNQRVCRPISRCNAVKLLMLRTIRLNISLPRTARNVFASAASRETRNSSKAGLDQFTLLARRQQRAVGIKKGVDAALFQIADHLWQVLHEHRLTHAMHDKHGRCLEPGR